MELCADLVQQPVSEKVNPLSPNVNIDILLSVSRTFLWYQLGEFDETTRHFILGDPFLFLMT